MLNNIIQIKNNFSTFSTKINLISNNVVTDNNINSSFNNCFIKATSDVIKNIYTYKIPFMLYAFKQYFN